MKSSTLSKYLHTLAILCSITLCGCYTQFATTDDTPSSDEQQTVVVNPPILLPGIYYTPNPGHDHDRNQLSIPPAAGTHSAPASTQQVAPTRESGHTRGKAATPAQTNTERTSEPKRGGR